MEYQVLFNILAKLLFFVGILLQIILWPTVWTLTFAAVVALEGLVTYFMTPKAELTSKVFGKGIFFLHGSQTTSVRQYLVAAFVGIYSCFYLVAYLSAEIDYQPHMTNWIPRERLQFYTPGEPLPDVEVTDELSKTMRKNTFTWPKTHEDIPILLNGTLSDGKPTKNGNDIKILNNLRCDPQDATLKYACYATNLKTFSVPDRTLYGRSYSFVPMSSQFYVTDVKITPKKSSSLTCEALEFYRIIVNSENQAVYALDYPASTLPNPSSANIAFQDQCGLFQEVNWCLRYQHTFSFADYRQKIAQKCQEGQGSIIFRLPVRTIDVNPKNGKVELDTMIISKDADVTVKHTWHYETDNLPNIIKTLEQWHAVDGDLADDWRNSSDAFQVFMKFAIAITPFLIVWYYLATEFEQLVPQNHQVFVICIFVLLPAVFIFMSVGAWLPMAGCIVCAIAINHPPAESTHTMVSKLFRPVLFFIFAVCNSIQFCWILVLIFQADFSAFYYEYSLKQLSSMTHNFIISGSTSPSWVALVMPTVLSINLAFFLGSIICFILEMKTFYRLQPLR